MRKEKESQRSLKKIEKLFINLIKRDKGILE